MQRELLLKITHLGRRTIYAGPEARLRFHFLLRVKWKMLSQGLLCSHGNFRSVAQNLHRCSQDMGHSLSSAPPPYLALQWILHKHPITSSPPSLSPVAQGYEVQSFICWLFGKMPLCLWMDLGLSTGLFHGSLILKDPYSPIQQVKRTLNI